MGGEGSGRRELLPTDCDLPELGEDEAAVGRFVDAVAVGVAVGQMDPRTADTLKDLARTKLAAIRQVKERSRIDDLKAIISRAEQVRADGLRHAQRVRQHREEPTVLGHWDRAEWEKALASVDRPPRVRRADGEDDAED